MINFTVIMPTFNQAAYIRNAINSLFSQTYKGWELIIVDDGCTDDTFTFIRDYLSDERVRYIRNEANKGLGYSINKALTIARYSYIAYLPSDDYYYDNHLEVLKKVYEEYPNSSLVYTGMTSGVSDSLLKKKYPSINGIPLNFGLQLVQTSHILTDDRWADRSEWVSENLYKTFWYKLTASGDITYIDEITCHWTDHPCERHKIMSETYGGHINRYRQYYGVKNPIRMKVSAMKFIKEDEIYSKFHKIFPHKNDSLKILIVGELSYNPERIYAFEESGHKLYGLWTNRPAYSFSNVGHLPFGHVKDINYDDFENEIKKIKPDVIYGLLNYCAVPLAYEVLKKFPDIPFVWHYKEGPFLCIEHETWDKLIYLYTKSTGVIYLNDELKKWYEQFTPQHKLSMVLDGDLPKLDFFKDDFCTKMSSIDNEIHTVIAGRAVGLEIEDIKKLADNHIHIHLYNESYEEAKVIWLRKAIKESHGYFHIHYHCDPEDWTKEFSKYDAGWLHCFNSKNNGDIRRCSWNDFNMPARLNTLMAAGIPSIQKDNSKHIVAMQSIVKRNDCGIFYKDIDDLVKQLHNSIRIKELSKNVMKCRKEFSFDEHVPSMVEFFRNAIKNKQNELQ